MKKNNLDAFKAKANAILLKDAMLNVNGGQVDADSCHIAADGTNGYLKIEAGYTNDQVNFFFSNPQWAQQFNSMYAPGDVHLAEQRMMYFDSIVNAPSTGG